MKLWDKGYSINTQAESFTVGNDYLLDERLVEFDCKASITHANVLLKISILTATEHKAIVDCLLEIIQLHKIGKFQIFREDEDCHTAIENYLTQKLGDTGKKIHAGRSRNDQILTALRLYYIMELKQVKSLAAAFISALENFKAAYGDVPFPGYTHMRKAMPSSVAMWAQCFEESMKDNLILTLTAETLLDQSPLGTGAGFGLPIHIDRKFMADELGFAKVQNNPMYVQLSRSKFESFTVACLNNILFDLNRMASDVIMFSMDEFGFFVIPDEFCTGSSIMPQKKNPDTAEIIRAKYQQNVAFEIAIKTTASNLISGYSRDLQMTKEPAFRAIDNVKECLHIMTLILGKMKVDSTRCEMAMTKELYAAQKAYKLVSEGMPFRDAYRKISQDFR